jgi:hypothetical protein
MVVCAKSIMVVLVIALLLLIILLLLNHTHLASVMSLVVVRASAVVAVVSHAARTANPASAATWVAESYAFGWLTVIRPGTKITLRSNFLSYKQQLGCFKV